MTQKELSAKHGFLFFEECRIKEKAEVSMLCMNGRVLKEYEEIKPDLECKGREHYKERTKTYMYMYI